MDVTGKIIGRGAEAILYLNDNGVLVKNRIKKNYRIEEIDTILRRLRTRHEARILTRAKRVGVNTPSVIDVREYEIFMEFIDGKLLKEVLNSTNSSKRREFAREIGKMIGKLHSAGIIHGDLTTSNMILKDDKIYFIDFGLALHSTSVEDRAVDLYLLHQAYQSTHFRYVKELWRNTEKGYMETFKDWDVVLKRIEQISKRGRYAKR